jgi:hypothetical protein
VTVQHSSASPSAVVDRFRCMPPQVRSLRWKFCVVEVSSIASTNVPALMCSAPRPVGYLKNPPSSPAWPT